jgi:hypothetical protein
LSLDVLQPQLSDKLFQRFRVSCIRFIEIVSVTRCFAIISEKDDSETKKKKKLLHHAMTDFIFQRRA